MANKEYTAVLLKLPALSVESLEFLKETIKEHLRPSSPPDGHPLDVLHYWHEEDYPEDWGGKFCANLAELNSVEVFDIHVQAAKIQHRKKQRRG